MRKKFLEMLPPKQFDVCEYRVIYGTTVDVVNVVLIGQRNDDEVYRDLERLH